MADDARAGAAQRLLLDRYRVEGLLGEGGLGTVVKVFDTRLKNMRAIKTLKRSITTDPEVFGRLEDRFTREAEAGSRMGINPNLVAVYDLVADNDGTLYLILEYVPGGTLAERIKQGPLPLADALRLTADAARGLQAAHAVGLVHRDVKPANIFLAADGRAQVGDFGIAQIDDLSGRTRTTVGHPGTPLYMSPEQARQTAYVQPASDQYSLGLVLFEMLTGVSYRRLRAPDLQARLAALPPPVRALIERMTAESPDDRYPSMGAALAAIQAIERYIRTANGEPMRPADIVGQRPFPPPPGIPAPPDAATPVIGATSGTPPVNLQPVQPLPYPPPTTPPVPRRGGSRGVLIGVGGLLVVVVVAVGAFFTFGRGGSPTHAPPTATAQATTAAGQLTATSAPATVTPTTSAPSATGAAGTSPASSRAGTTPPVALGPAPVTSLLSYLDGRVTLPGEPRSDDYKTITGDPVQVIGVDLSRGEPAKLPAVTAPNTSRVVRTIWAPKGTLLATLVRVPIQGGFSDNLDLVVIDIATGKATTVAKAINTLPAWSPDGMTLVYGLITGREKSVATDQDGKPITTNGTPFAIESTGYDVHLVNADGTKNRVIAHLIPFGQCGGGGGLSDPIVDFVSADQFVAGQQQTAWAADDSRIAIKADVGTFTLRPDGSQVKQVASCRSPDLSDIIGATTGDPYIPANGVQIRLQDDADALRWRYEQNLFPTTILSGCTFSPDEYKPCDNTKKGTANAGYRNQIVVRLPDGTEKTITSAPTFKYHVTISPDGTAVAFTGITVFDYAAAIGSFNPLRGYRDFLGYTTDVYLVRITGGAVQKVSTSGGAHHPSWQRDLPVKIPAHPTPTPTVPPTPVPPRTPLPTRSATGTPKP